jgi:hypothetical protein
MAEPASFGGLCAPAAKNKRLLANAKRGQPQIVLKNNR